MLTFVSVGLGLAATHAFAGANSRGSNFSVTRSPIVATTDGRTLRLTSDQIYLGTKTGAIIGYDRKSSRPTIEIKSPEKSPIRDIVLLDRNVWWIHEDSRTLRGSINGNLVSVELGIKDPSLRLGVWQGRLTAHSASQLRFIDPVTRRVHLPRQVLPKEVAEIAERSSVLTVSESGTDVLVAIERLTGPNLNPENVVRFTAWKADAYGAFKGLGTYSGRFPSISFESTSPKDRRASTAPDPQHVLINRDGVIAFKSDKAVFLPFGKKDWAAEERALSSLKKPPSASALTGNSIWWSNDGKIVSASLEDGSQVEFALPNPKTRVYSLQADDGEAYALTDEGIINLRLEQKAAVSWVSKPEPMTTVLTERSDAFGGIRSALPSKIPLLDSVIPIGVGRPNPNLGHDLFFTWSSEDPDDVPSNELQQQLASMLDQWIGVPYVWGGASLTGTDCSGLVTSLYSSLGIKLPRHSQDIGRAPVGEVVVGKLKFGDVLVFPHPKHCAIYIGNGRIIEAVSGGVTYNTLKRFDRAIVRRFLPETSR